MRVAKGLPLWLVSTTPCAGLSFSECGLAQAMVTRPGLDLELLYFLEGPLLVI